MKNDKCDRRFDCDDYKYDHCDGCGGNKPQGDLISREALKKEFQDRLSACEDWINHTECDISRAIATRDFCIEVIMTINNAPTVDTFTFDDMKKGINVGYKAGRLSEKCERPRGECRTCSHRDPEDKKCDCGGKERQGCPFPVSDDYFCKFYEKGGAE